MTVGMISLLAGVLVALVFWPRHGWRARRRTHRLLAERVGREDALKHMLKCEAHGQEPSVESLAGVLQSTPNRTAALLNSMERHGLVSYDAGHIALRPAGRDLALHIIRAHRLWESYLAEHTGVAELEWHREAEKHEHLLSQQQTNQLAARLGHPARDPHGDFIPTEDGTLITERGRSLNTLPLNTPAIIEHIEDEPQSVYAALTAEGLRRGMKAYVIERDPHRNRVWAEGRVHELSPLLAHNISVLPLEGMAPAQLQAERTLADLMPGEVGRVGGLSAACRGPERRRLLDLGFVPGSTISIELISPTGDPVAYRVRGSVIALRRHQARFVRLAKPQPAAA